MQKKKKTENVHNKKMPIWARVLLVLVVIFLGIAGVLFGYAQYTIGRIEKIDPSAIEHVSPDQETFEVDEELPDQLPGVLYLDPNDVIWADADTTVMKEKDVVNILLIGQDRRQGEERQRSDAMIMATINKKEKKIVLTSLMRDLYVQIPGYSDNRINAAYAFGGMKLLDETIEKNFGIHIDGNIEVDFQAFKICIDKLGGIDIELTKEEADYLNRRGNWDDNDASAGTWNLICGVNHLTGEQALAFSRIRYVGNGDYERTERQRRILSELFSEGKKQSVSTLIEIINEMVPYISTDLSTGEILGYAFEVLSLGTDEVEAYRIPIDGGYQSAVIRQMMVLVPDLEKNREYLRETLYEK